MIADPLDFGVARWPRVLETTCPWASCNLGVSKSSSTFERFCRIHLLAPNGSFWDVGVYSWLFDGEVLTSATADGAIVNRSIINRKEGSRGQSAKWIVRNCWTTNRREEPSREDSARRRRWLCVCKVLGVQKLAIEDGMSSYLMSLTEMTEQSGREFDLI